MGKVVLYSSIIGLGTGIASLLTLMFVADLQTPKIVFEIISLLWPGSRLLRGVIGRPTNADLYVSYAIAVAANLPIYLIIGIGLRVALIAVGRMRRPPLP